MKPAGPGLLFVGRFLITDSISVLVIGLFIFLPGSVSEGCAFLRICAFLPDCPFYWHRVAVVISHDPLYFCSVSCYFSFFISNSIDLSLLPFSLDESRSEEHTSELQVTSLARMPSSA